MNIGVGCAEGRLLEEARGIGGVDDGGWRGAVHEGDEVGGGAGPGAGFRTCRSRLPASVGFTVAVSCPPLLKVVGTGEPFWRTWAPEMNFWPWTTTVAGPTLNDRGLADVRIGMGFRTETF